ncbi:ribokinase [Sulfitobacter undariae]|uniref:Ribokinase n=1 Tax=Sulfitobacter undariae TaxID=1563671 RepID=A0A7W6E755_9RHOB|nr:carbohydrate kinase family protein [Sulfitobacter undariae]MBB3995948.1 ribokinase [Sulfitobacter undariae]
MSKIAIVGSVTLDFVFQIPRMPEAHEKLQAGQMIVAGGGSASNVAHWLSSLGHDVKMFSVVGDDPMSSIAVDSLAQAGVDITGIRRMPGIGPSVMAIFTNGNYKSMVGAGTWDVAKSCWDEMLRETDFSTFDRVHIIPKVYGNLFGTGRRADLVDIPVSADLNGTYSPQMIADLDLAFSNYDEISAQTGTSDIRTKVAADLTGKQYALIVTRSREDVTSYGSGTETRIKPKAVDVIDRAGGGDAFCAGYLHAMNAGASSDTAIKTGLHLAGIVISALGCRPASAEVDATLCTLKIRFPT